MEPRAPAEAVLSTYDEFSSGRLQDWYAGLSFEKADRMDGSPFTDGIDLYGNVSFRNGTGAYLDVGISRREAYRDRILTAGFWWGGRDLYRNGGLGVTLGKQAGGEYLYWRVSQGWQVNNRLSVYGSYEYGHIKEPSPDAYCARQLVASVVYDFDPERTLGGRVVSRDGKTNFYLAFKQRVRAGLDAYVILGDPNAASTRSSVTLKLVRPL